MDGTPVRWPDVVASDTGRELFAELAGGERESLLRAECGEPDMGASVRHRGWSNHSTT